MSGYPGFQGNNLGGADVEMGTVGANSRVPPNAQYNQQGQYNYGQPQIPTYGYNNNGGGKPSSMQPPPQQNYGYGGPQAAGGYNPPPIAQPPPQATQSTQTPYIYEMELAVRHGFVRKVYGILFAQLLLTFGIVVVFSYIPAVQGYAINNSWLVYVSIASVFGIIIAMTCCPGKVMERFPMNIILLMILSLFEGFALGTIAAAFACDKTVYSAEDKQLVCVNEGTGAINGRYAVLLAMGITLVVVVALSIFACQTKYDFTGWGPYLTVTLIIFLVFFLIAGFWLRFNDILYLVYACIGVLIFSAMLVYNTQRVVGGKNRRYQLSPDSYIFGALVIYLDIINMFMFILSIIGFSRR